MFGYVRAYKPEMKFKDYDLYKGVYCSLCKEIGRHYGIIARLTLSYDFTFFAMMRMAVRNECVSFCESHCSFNPAKKCLDCGRDNKDIAYTADVSMLMLYYKLKDNIDDSSFFKKFLCRLAMPYARHIYKKASAFLPEESQFMEKQMNKQTELEGKNAGVDEAAEPSAKMLSELLASRLECDNINQLKRFGYFIGRWVYLTDAADDCEKDIKSGNFNPVKSRFNDENFEEYCRQLLNHTMGEAVNAYNLLKIYRFDDIISNIVYDGTYAVMNRVLKKEALR